MSSMDIQSPVRGARDAWRVRHLRFRQLESGKISVRAETPRGTRLEYKLQTVGEEQGFLFRGTRYKPETVAAITGKGLWKRSFSGGSLVFSGVVALGTNLWEFGRGKKFGSAEFWDATVKNCEFWVSTGVDWVVSVAVGAAAAAVVAGVIAAAPLFLPAAGVAFIATPAVAIVATALVGMGIGWGVDATGFPKMAKTWLNRLFSGSKEKL